MPRKLKVFRTSTGFHDAYVAAPSRKAALAAWGADADLFARGVAEQVTDPKLMAQPLERPGERHSREAEVLEAKRDALERQLEMLRAKQDREAAKLGRRRDEAREAYREALERWSE